MNLEHYKAASERTDADERALIPAIKHARPENWHPAPNKAQHSPLPDSYALQSALESMIEASESQGIHPDKINAFCDHYSRAVNHADKLAEALRETVNALHNETYHDPRTGKSDSPWIASVKFKAREALAAYEAAQ